MYAGTLEHGELPLPTPEHTILNLPDLTAPRTSYMLSKIYGEAMIRQSELPFTIVRPHNVYGPRMGMAHVIPELLKKAHEAPVGGTVEVFSVDHTRTFCYVDDAVAMLLRVAEAESCSGKTLNLGNQAPEIAIGELAGLIIRTVGRSQSTEPAPATPGSPSRRCPDMSRMASLTGYRAEIGIEDGVARTYAWYQDQFKKAASA